MRQIVQPPVPFKGALSGANEMDPRTPDRDTNHAHGAVAPPSDVWQSLAVCESGMNGEPRWDYNGNSGFDGGLQFHPRTWTAFKSASDPSYAYAAPPSRQIAVAKRVAAAQGAGAWPSCTAKLGISTEDLLNG